LRDWRSKIDFFEGRIIALNLDRTCSTLGLPACYTLTPGFLDTKTYLRDTRNLKFISSWSDLSTGYRKFKKLFLVYEKELFDASSYAAVYLFNTVRYPEIGVVLECICFEIGFSKAPSEAYADTFPYIE